ncbi:ABC-type branched-subunit amino acid transport system ATPase component [Acidovorax delafieldii]|uniref:branched-chain amino acid ABC transporter ATP-binding protein n=1 Tax=Acidovorax delafieldii TaxID=47920 RepID=UPI00285ABA71|nr:ABC transporter ATP-binding protein [Acidovorax delafieldii]MDR6155593.1 ABC-type branched-subunit amino acid transport system ATPase component [Acidovorax delafieldii]
MNAAAFPQPALVLQGITSGYRSSLVLRDLSLDVRKGEAVALLGKNGMGKSTLLKTVMGYLAKKAGTIHLHGENITRMPPHRIARQGVAYASQEQPLFADLSIRDNMRLGLAQESWFEERFAGVEPLFPVFKSRLQQYAGTLSGGEQKMLLLARALMMRPKVILLDEITEGLQPSVIDRLANALLQERAQHGTTLLIVEQNVPFALKVADRYVILKQGELVDEGLAKVEGAVDRVFGHLRV